MPGERVKVDIDGRGVWLTHLDRVMFDSGFTKAEVVDYYAAVADVLLPHLADRPLTLIRYPEGVAAGGFFAKNAPTGTPNWVRRAPLATSDGDIDFVVAESRATLAWLPTCPPSNCTSRCGRSTGAAPHAATTGW